ncbi:S41 family peptidase [Microbulbifer sp. SSSA002]|uniref:S41 family peptidase n=1 Tax=Microbulbifer sp. SSSA002 TaxID=3243376 RepID=UPI004039EED3
MKRQLKLSLAVFIGFFTPPLSASDSATACQFERAAVIRAAAAAIRQHYVLKEKGYTLSAQLQQLAASEPLSQQCRDQALFADSLSEKIHSLSGDQHFYVTYIDPQRDATDWIAQWRAEAPRNNYGVQKIEILPGNTAYLSLSAFHTLENAQPTLAAAFTLLRHSEGLILDLRSNGGGDEDTANAIMQSFIDPQAPLPFVIESRTAREIPQRISPLPWPAYGTERPLVVLIDGRSFSAAESTAFALQQLGRATVIGTASAGGAHMLGEPQPLPYGFTIGIPHKRPLSTIAGARRNWEGQGVIPDIQAGAGEIIPLALKVIAQQR